jgi:PAS domain S-box-containing protein
MNNPGAGYILLDLEKELELLDYNQEACRVLNVKSRHTQKLVELIREYFTDEDWSKIKEMSAGGKYKKEIQTNKYGIKHHIDIFVNRMNFRQKNAYLLRIVDVTDDVRKRDELKLSEKRYRKLYYRNKAGVFTINRKSVLLDGNAAFFEMFEHTLSIGDRLFSLKNERDWELILESLGESESSQNYQTQFTLSNDAEKTFIFSWYLDTLSNNIEGSVIDLTSIQQTSQALKQSEEKYRLIFEESNDAILLLENDKIVDFNRKTMQLFGLSRKDIIHRQLYELSATQDEISREEYVIHKAKLSNSRSVKFDWLFNGGDRIIEADVTLIEIMIGQQVVYQCVIHDNTEQNKNLRAIRKNQRNLENILENTPEGFLIVRNDEVLYKNSEIVKLTGGNVDLHTLFVDADQKRFLRAYKRHIEERTIQNLQLTLNNKENGDLLMDVTIVSTNFEEEDATLIIVKDVSVQNTLAKEMLRAELAEESNKKLAKEIMERIRAEKQLEEQFLRTKAILDSSSNTFLLTVSNELKVTSFNTHCLTYFTMIINREIKIGSYFESYFVDTVSPERLRMFKRYAHEVRSGKSKQFEVRMEARAGEYWLEIFMNPIFDVEGNVSEISLVAHDISEKKKASIEIEESLREKEVLLKEIHHRVKNNLQVISSILNLQSSFVEDEQTLEILQESRNRIRSMAIIHENLYRTEDFSSIKFSNYLDNLANSLIASYRINQQIEMVTDFDDVDLMLDQAIPCGLLVNELITNALKYAWKEGEAGTIRISFKQHDQWALLEISDDGVGLPFDFEEMKSDTLGLQLVITLVEQLDGSITADISKGTKYLIKFEIAKF